MFRLLFCLLFRLLFCLLFCLFCLLLFRLFRIIERPKALFRKSGVFCHSATGKSVAGKAKLCLSIGTHRLRIFPCTSAIFRLRAGKEKVLHAGLKPPLVKSLTHQKVLFLNLRIFSPLGAYTVPGKVDNGIQVIWD